MDGPQFLFAFRLIFIETTENKHPDTNDSGLINYFGQMLLNFYNY